MREHAKHILDHHCEINLNPRTGLMHLNISSFAEDPKDWSSHVRATYTAVLEEISNTLIHASIAQSHTGKRRAKIQKLMQKVLGPSLKESEKFAVGKMQWTLDKADSDEVDGMNKVDWSVLPGVPAKPGSNGFESIDLDSQFEAQFFEDGKGEPSKKLTPKRKMQQRRWTLRRQRTVKKTDESTWRLVRFEVEPTQGAGQDLQGQVYTPWTLWDYRWWVSFRRLPHSSYSLGVRFLVEEDIRTMRELAEGAGKEKKLAKLLEDFRGPSRFTLPVVVAFPPDGSEREREVGKVVGLPWLGAAVRADKILDLGVNILELGEDIKTPELWRMEYHQPRPKEGDI